MSNTAEQLHCQASLFSLLENVPGVPENLAAEMNATVSGINLDSRLVRKGDLFLPASARTTMPGTTSTM